MRFSLAICTHNRAHCLAPALASALSQKDAPGGFEVLVVDNRSSDATREVAARSGARYVFEDRLGLSFARNRAFAEARGEVIVYMDDDARAHPRYLARLAGLLDTEPKVGAAGGPVEVGWAGPPPSWYEPGLDAHLNRLYLGSCRREIRYPETLYGTSMAFPIPVLKRLGGFNHRLGRAGNGLADSEEAELLLRVQRNLGLRVLYDPGLKMTHVMAPERLSPRYLLDKAYGHGRSRRLMESMHPGTGGVGNVALALAESFLRTALGKKRGELTERLIARANLGYLREWMAQAGRKRR